MSSELSASLNLANLLEAAAIAAGVDVDILEAVNVEIPGGRLTARYRGRGRRIRGH